MGIVRPDGSNRAEIEEFRRMLLSCAAVHRTKTDDESRKHGRLMPEVRLDDDVEEKKVCVTCGVSFLGIAIVKQLLLRGYSVRVIVDNQEDLDRLREMEICGEMGQSMNGVEAVMASLTQIDSLSQAFNGCRGVFHTASFIDPAGLSGYSKWMAEVELTLSKNVIEACAVTSSVKKCVHTSSLVACIWQDFNTSLTIDHHSWSDESICLNKKLWYALGKLKAERMAWSVAREKGLKLATICPGLITGPESLIRNPTSTIAYLKGAQEMFRNGLLATVDVNRLGKAHVLVYEEMNKTAAPGRYVCYDQVIRSEDDYEKLATETGIDISSTSGNSTRFRSDLNLSNAKLSRLFSTTNRCNN